MGKILLVMLAVGSAVVFSTPISAFLFSLTTAVFPMFAISTVGTALGWFRLVVLVAGVVVGAVAFGKHDIETAIYAVGFFVCLEFSFKVWSYGAFNFVQLLVVFVLCMVILCIGGWILNFTKSTDNKAKDKPTPLCRSFLS
ncbi:MAG: hypothetical protein FWG65_02450 [Turicibacter sp.]|nr:hypothetical protein [Turicibacter sp.]